MYYRYSVIKVKRNSDELGKIKARTVAGYLETGMDELNLNLRIRKVEDGWEASAYRNDGGGGCGVFGGTPQRAMLRLALALICRPVEVSHLQKSFAVDDPVSRRVIGEAENAARAADRQMAGGICSVEQCQSDDAPT